MIAGTIFESSNLPLMIWFQAIYLLIQIKKDILAMQRIDCWASLTMGPGGSGTN